MNGMVRSWKKKGWDRRDWSRETGQLISMTWPVILELLLTGVINTGSQYYLNAYSSDAVAVQGSLSQVVSFASNLYTLISVGGSILLAPMIGAVKARESGVLIRTMLLCNLILAGVVSACTLALSGTFMHMMGIESALRDLGQQYLTVNFGLSFVQAMMVTYSAVFRSIGRMKDMLVANFTVYMVCFLLNAAVYYGMPLGEQKLLYYALNGIIGQMLGVCFLAVKLHIYMKKRGMIIKIKDSGRTILRYLKRILQFGIPGGMEGTLFQVTQLVIVSMMGTLGTESLLVKSYVGIFGGYMVICTVGIQTAVFVLIGQKLGEKNSPAIRSIFRIGLIMGFALTLLVGLGMILFSRPILHLFTDTESVIHQVQALLWLQLAMELARVLAALSISGLKAIGETGFPLLMVIPGSFCSILIAYLLGIRLGLGLPGIWLGYIADLLLRGLAETAVFYRRTTDDAIRRERVMGEGDIIETNKINVK